MLDTWVTEKHLWSQYWGSKSRLPDYIGLRVPTQLCRKQSVTLSFVKEKTMRSCMSNDFALEISMIWSHCKKWLVNETKNLVPATKLFGKIPCTKYFGYGNQKFWSIQFGYDNQLCVVSTTKLFVTVTKVFGWGNKTIWFHSQTNLVSLTKIFTLLSLGPISPPKLAVAAERHHNVGNKIHLMVCTHTIECSSYILLT